MALTLNVLCRLLNYTASLLPFGARRIQVCGTYRAADGGWAAREINDFVEDRSETGTAGA